MPLLPPNSFNSVRTPSGDKDFPSIAIASPFSNSISMYVALSGAFSGETVL